MTDIKFPAGLSIFPPNEKAPDFIKADMVVTNEFIQFFNTNQKQGKLRLQLKESRNGKLYAEVNTWEKPSTIPETKEQINKILNPNVTEEEAEILAQHRAKHNKKVESEGDEEDMSMEEFAKSIPF